MNLLEKKEGIVDNDLGLNPVAVWTGVSDLVDDLIEAGGEEDQIVVAVSEFLDAALPLDILIPGAPGIAAEALDGKLFALIVPLFIKVFRVDPEKRAARKAKRAARKAARQA
jgi:hypothetical protein